MQCFHLAEDIPQYSRYRTSTPRTTIRKTTTLPSPCRPITLQALPIATPPSSIQRCTPDPAHNSATGVRGVDCRGHVIVRQGPGKDRIRPYSSGITNPPQGARLHMNHRQSRIPRGSWQFEHASTMPQFRCRMEKGRSKSVTFPSRAQVVDRFPSLTTSSRTRSHGIIIAIIVVPANELSRGRAAGGRPWPRPSHLC